MGMKADMPPMAWMRAAMAGLDAELGVAAHEVRGHGDLRAVGQEDGGVGGELFDEGEDVVPAAAVEAGGVLAELVEDLVHLEGGEDGFDENGALGWCRAGCRGAPAARRKMSFQRRASRCDSILGR